MGAYTLLQDLTVASNSTSVVLNNFGTITKDDFVKVVTTFVNASANTNVISLFANTATTATNYHRQVLIGNGTSAAASRQNLSRFDDVLGSVTSTTVAYIKLSENNRFNYFSNNTRTNTSGVQLLLNYVTSSGATFSSGIDTLTFTGDQTSGIGTGSRIQIYRLDAEKVADITVASNTTQVDISNLSIDKDSEYLLVSDIDYGGGSTPFYSLFVNDDTTQANYFSQRIIGNGNTASAARNNISLIVSFGTTSAKQAIIYTHIKLSNIGAYTSQNYSLAEVGNTIPIISNSFVSSVSENITSITKLNIQTQLTNAIGSGSRFTLYKLYE